MAALGPCQSKAPHSYKVKGKEWLELESVEPISKRPSLSHSLGYCHLCPRRDNHRSQTSAQILAAAFDSCFTWGRSDFAERQL